MTDPYSVLEVSRDASDDEIKKAYRNLSRKYHPDTINSFRRSWRMKTELCAFASDLFCAMKKTQDHFAVLCGKAVVFVALCGSKRTIAENGYFYAQN